MGIAALVADIIIAYVVAGRYGPSRARRLIIEDPEYVATRTSLNSIHAMLEQMEKPDLKPVEKALERLETAATRARDVAVTLPPAAVDEAMKDLKRRLKSILREELAEALKTDEQELTPEAATAMADQVMQGNVLAGLAQQYPDVPPQIWKLAHKVGLPWVAEYLGIPLEALTGA
jgi:hypothetical protein